MSLPISPIAALGIAQLAGRAVQGTVEAVAEFADVLGQESAEATSVSSADDAAAREATESLRGVLVDWMRQFGLHGDEPIDVRLDDVSGQVEVGSPDLSLPVQSRIGDLQDRINSDMTLRQSIVDSLKQIPGQSASLRFA